SWAASGLAAERGPSVKELLSNPPAPGEVVEVDAYFSGAGAPVLPGGWAPTPGSATCPEFANAALTDEPFQPILMVLNSAQANYLSTDDPWLIATVPEATRPNVRVLPQLPYHARLRGHLGDPAFAHCRFSER